MENNCGKTQHIMKCLELAMLIEVSAEKPGNVNFASDFAGTRVEHFLASAIAAGPVLQEAANRGVCVSEKRLDLGNVGVGELIKDCAVQVAAWQRGGNTVLGTVILFVPLAVATGITRMSENTFDFSVLRKNVDFVVKATTSIDAVQLYEAVDVACPSGLGTLKGAPDLDVTDPRSKQHLLEQNVSLFEVFKLGASFDDVCFEWVNNYAITFGLAYPYLMDQLKSKPLNVAVVHTFLKILSKRPDTFIARKVGVEKAKQVSTDAQVVLEMGGLETYEGKKALLEFDSKLRTKGNSCNPGTTADLVASALALCTLGGYRP